MVIQTYEAQYRDQIIRLILQIQCDEFQVSITLDDQPDLLKIPQVYQRGTGNFWIALDRNQVIGTIGLIDIGQTHAALRKMFVHSQYRGKMAGIGQALLDTLLQWSVEQHISEIYLGTIEVFEAAQRFYQKNGFVEIQNYELPEHFPVMAGDNKFYKYYSINVL
ncbi:MAG: GNAT family N-acetyltransferase [Oscillatoriales cyanobacterium RM2_1_1]|nr:GNAT family N-acetyltransferase [Oscillatoriales cyanobacterium SM2_3_0]NJO46650.1 GNAT family N-acetyltransferase [Oscillatoriales cyanobacterium RM2_1_1]